MNLLFITERFPPDIGGVARSAERIVQSLTNLGVEVDVVTWSRYLEPGEVLPPLAYATSNPLIQVRRIGLYRHWDMTLPHTLNLLDWQQQQRAYDAVWGHYLFPAGFLAVWFGQLNHLPTVVSARGNDLDRGMFPPGDFARLQWTLAQATLITAVSQDMARKVQALSQRAAIVQRNVVDTEMFCPGLGGEAKLRDRLNIASDEVILGFSGELREKKGQRFLLSVLSQVRSLRPACLLIIGEARPETQALLQSYAMSQGDDAARIVITGYLDEPKQVAQHLRLCDLYLQPSLWDGMPNALLEAMACGCVCIGSDAGGIAEVIDSGTDGFLLPRSQLHQLGPAVLEALQLEPTARQAMGRAARDRVLQNHSLTHEQAMLQQILEKLSGLAS
ncbi:glycosyltransferase [Romeria aff. gracilis LEGE 07310]|uniref:Glycosyltransferase n=1 Tax=Vasconcelosia minhoensis LEGE 07310 TaxID=915328 RepID=A0A8J7AJC5_9CYAN|nr:glycosyltransferase [Romeria gracilis]MBE9080024.1 glycosyltransferase [Romeria aff. gracilis LEGE 07310]